MTENISYPQQSLQFLSLIYMLYYRLIILLLISGLKYN